MGTLGSNNLRFGAALSSNPDTSQALVEVCQQATKELASPANLAMLFASPHHEEELDQASKVIFREVGTECLLGCTGESIVGTGRELERTPALSLLIASLPEANVQPMHLGFEQTAEGGTFVGWPDELTERWPEGAIFLLLGDPFSFPADQLILRLNDDQPGISVVGGMASGAARPGQNKLLLGQQVHREGAVAVLVHGNFEARTVVSQGCRPIGTPFVITKANRNIIAELGGKPTIQCLQEVFEALSSTDQQLVRYGLHVGRVINEYQDEFGRGDFLVRNVQGVDEESGAIMIGDQVRPGQTIQFHVRDADTADEDLRELLDRSREGHAGTLPRGALLFTCNGRGTNLFDQPDHDAGILDAFFDQVPTAGFFAAGELGPIGGKNFLHGFTASVVLFYPETS